MAKWISDSASTLSPLQTSIRCTLPTKKSMHYSPTSMTARSELGAERERKVGWKGQVGGPAETACSGPPPKVGVAGGAAQVDVDHIGGGVEGCRPTRNIIHPSAPNWYVTSSN